MTRMDKENESLKEQLKAIRDDLEWAVDIANYWVDNKFDKQKCCDLEYKYKLKINHDNEE